MFYFVIYHILLDEGEVKVPPSALSAKSASLHYLTLITLITLIFLLNTNFTP